MKALLWVDDNEQLIDESTPAFRAHGFTVHKAAGVAAALTALRTIKLDGVILDVRLAGGENGLELLEDLRERHPNLPVVVFTGYLAYEDVVRASLRRAYYWPKLGHMIPIDDNERARFFQALHNAMSQTPPSTGAAEAERTGGLMRAPQFWWVPILLALLTGAGWLIRDRMAASGRPGTVVGQFSPSSGPVQLFIDGNTKPAATSDSTTGFFRIDSVSTGTHQLRYVGRSGTSRQVIEVRGGTENVVTPPSLKP